MKVSGLVEKQDNALSNRSWMLQISTTKFNGHSISGESIVEKILCPSSLSIGEIKVIYNPKMEPWLKEEEAMKLKKRLKILMELPLTFSYDNERVTKALETVWNGEEIKEILAIPDNREAELLEIMRRKKIYKKLKD